MRNFSALFGMVALVAGCGGSLSPRTGALSRTLIGTDLPIVESPLLTLAVGARQSGLGLVNGTVSTDYRFAAGGQELCGHQVRDHAFADGTRLVLGTVPEVDGGAELLSDQPSLGAATARTERYFADVRGLELGAVSEDGSCLHLTRDERGVTQLVPALRLRVEAGGLPYHALVTASALVAVEDAFFSAVDGQGRVFAGNRLTGAAELRPLPGLVGDGTLATELVKTSVPAKRARATSADNIFDFAPTDGRFEEVQMFYNLQTHLAFAQGSGFKWYGLAPLTAFAHTPPSGVHNNALYLEGSKTEPPRIMVDDGDGTVLQNLSTDQDVISHEFGHHIIFKTLTKKSGESLVLHEGLADFLVFARTGDPCLGESICPAGSSLCQEAGRCLRTGTNPVAFGDTSWKDWEARRGGLAHLHGQLVSGMLWGLRARSEVPAEDLTALAFRAISLLKEDAELKDFLATLIAADAELFAGTYKDVINAAAAARALPTATPAVPVVIAEQNAATTPTPAPVLPGAAPEPSSETKSGGDKASCGVVGAGASGFPLFLVMAIPLGWTLRRRRTAPGAPP